MKPNALLRAIALAFLAAAPAALAQFNRIDPLISYQGRVQTGTPPADFNGTGQFKFSLVRGGTNSRLWNKRWPHCC